VSVVIPVHNGAAFIREAIESVRAQDYPRLEIIVVNDASEDETESIVRALPFDLCYYDFRTNLGPAEARNRGIREAAGDFIAFLDADDLWPEGKLRRSVSVLCADAALEFVQGKPRLLELDPEQGVYRETGAHLEDFPHYIGTSVFRRSVFSRVGPFDRSLRFGEDSDWYLRADEQKIQRATIDDITLLVRRHGQNMTWGKTPVELNLLRVFKGRLDRKRDRGEA